MIARSNEEPHTRRLLEPVIKRHTDISRPRNTPARFYHSTKPIGNRDRETRE